MNTSARFGDLRKSDGQPGRANARPRVWWRCLQLLGLVGAMLLGVSGQSLVAAREAAANYRVLPGETLGEIASRLGMPLQRLASINGIANPDLVVAGTLLQVEEGGSLARTQLASTTPASYLVKPGDTLSQIAQRTGVSLSALQSANGLEDPNLLKVGAKLQLPSGSSNTIGRSLRVVIDAGHDAHEIGASHRFADGTVLREDVLTLRVAMQLRALLQQAGHQVTLTRSASGLVNGDSRDLSADGAVTLVDELQARIDIANQAKADLFVSVHFNGHSNPAASGTYTFWNPDRPFAAQSKALAERVQEGLVRRLRAAGYETIDRGARTDSSVLGDDAYFLLGPRSDVIVRPSQMPGIIGEALFLTSPLDATALRDERVVDAVARGYFDGITAYAAGGTTAPPALAAAPVSTAEAAIVRAAAPPAASGPMTVATGPSFWTVYLVTHKETEMGARIAQQAATDASKRGLPADVLVSRSYEQMKPGFLVVSSGRFPTQEAAKAHLSRVVAAGYDDAYVRNVR